MKIRKAHSWETVPSMDWLARAVLLYDKVLVNPAAESRGQIGDPTFYGSSREEMMQNLVFQEFVETLEGVTEPAMPALLGNITREQALAMSAGADPSMLKAAFQMGAGMEKFHPEIDFYGHVWDMQTKGTIMAAVETFVPEHPEKLTKAQILDFRGENELRRTRFMSTADELIASFGTATTVEELDRVLRLTEQAVSEEYKKLEVLMQKANIENVVKAMGLTVAPPAAATWLASMLGVTPIAPLGAFSAFLFVVAQILQAKQEAQSSLRQDPWGYLWEMKRL